MHNRRLRLGYSGPKVNNHYMKHLLDSAASGYRTTTFCGLYSPSRNLLRFGTSYSAPAAASTLDTE
jgi:hypothetical protein